jgi:hypothetical protein
MRDDSYDKKGSAAWGIEDEAITMGTLGTGFFRGGEKVSGHERTTRWGDARHAPEETGLGWLVGLFEGPTVVNWGQPQELVG